LAVLVVYITPVSVPLPNFLVGNHCPPAPPTSSGIPDFFGVGCYAPAHLRAAHLPSGISYFIGLETHHYDLTKVPVFQIFSLHAEIYKKYIAIACPKL